MPKEAAIEKGKEVRRLAGEYITHPGNRKFGKVAWTFVNPLE
jgi:hypothetical protein